MMPLSVIAVLLLAVACAPAQDSTSKAKTVTPMKKIVKTPEEWRNALTPEQFRITRLKGTERAYSGPYWNNKDTGMYHCVCCGAELFSSETKYESCTGWPSFYDPVANDRVEFKPDNSLGMERIEVTCSQCGAHLGHVFDDGPQPTGMRYCLNGTALKFTKP